MIRSNLSLLFQRSSDHIISSPSPEWWGTFWCSMCWWWRTLFRLFCLLSFICAFTVGLVKTYLLGRLKEWCILIHIRIRCIIWWFALQLQISQMSCFQPISFRKSTAFISSFFWFSAYFCSWVFYLLLYTLISKLGFYRKLKKATPKEIIFYLSNLKFSVKERIIWRKTKPTKCSFWFVHSQLIKELILKKLLNLNSKESRAIYLSETFMDQICKSSNSYGANRSRHNLK